MEYRSWEHSKERALRYTRRCPEETNLYRIVYHNRDKLEWAWEERFQKEYDCLRNEVKNSLDKYLNCGLLAHGCARAKCQEPGCKHSILIAFSCKNRICPSCATKRALIFAEHLHKELLPPVPQRHLVFSIPKRLRPYFRYARKNCGLLFHAAWDTLQELYKAVLPQGRLGAVLVLQTSGESLNWNPHLHGIASNGVFDEQGYFHSLPHFSQEKFTELFTHKLLSSMKKEELIDESVVENILSWRHPGFSVWSGEPILPDQAESRLFLSKYIDRGPIAGSRIAITDNIVTYHTTDNLTHEFDPLEFLARLSPHIANKWESTVRYYGAYSHRVRGKQKKKLYNETSSITPEPLNKKKASKTWAALIKQVYEVDPLVCPKCKGYMKIVAFIQDPNEISKILTPLKIPKFKSPPPMRAPPTDYPSPKTYSANK